MEKEERDAGISTGYRIFSIVRTVLVYLLAFGIIAAAAFFAADRSPNKSLFGFRYYTVLTDSMLPEFASGDMVFVKIVKADTIEEGDIITFNPSSGGEAYLTHRVIDKLPNYQGTGVTCFRTKGDANNTEDSFLIDESRVVGTVQFHLPKLGYVLRFVQLRWYYIVPLVILLFVFMELIKRYFEMRSEDAEEDEQEEPNENMELGG
jgi:signal peptidase